MKTLELKLKKDVLIVEVDKSFNHFKIYDDEIGFIFIENSIPRKELIKGSYKFLCKGSKLTEEIASELVNSNDEYGVVMYQNYRTTSMCYFDEQINALDSFISAVESKGFYWLENPYGNETIFLEINNIKIVNEPLEWQRIEAEEKTFRNPLIFVKK